MAAAFPVPAAIALIATVVVVVVARLLLVLLLFVVLVANLDRGRMPLFSSGQVPAVGWPGPDSVGFGFEPAVFARSTEGPT